MRLNQKTPEDKKRVTRLLESNMPKAEIARTAQVPRSYVQQVAREVEAQKSVKLK